MEKRDGVRNSTSSPADRSVGAPSAASAAPMAHHQAASAASRASAVVEDPQTAAQRQAAAKLALRKQLEKTLLQVRPI